MPTLKGFATTRRLKASATTIRNLLTYARDMAITDQTAHLVVFDIDNGRCWLASSETFNPSTPLSSSLTARNSTVGTAAQNNTNLTSQATTNSVQQGTLGRASGILSVPHPMEQGVTLVALETNHNGQTVQNDSGAAYIYFSPTASAEDAVVYLQNTRNQVMTVSVEAASGRVIVRQLAPEEIETSGLRAPEN